MDLSDHIGTIVFAVIATAIITLVALIFVKTDNRSYIDMKEWKRTIHIEKFDWVHHSTTGSSEPAGAINVKKWTTHNTYYTGTSPHRVAHHTTTHHISYDVQEWTFSRDVLSTGNQSIELFWPTPIYNAVLKEREQSREQSFKYFFKIQKHKKEKTKTFESTDISLYEQLKCDRQYTCVLNGYGFVVGIKDGRDWLFK